jgi:hypothetical protein
VQLTDRGTADLAHLLGPSVGAVEGRVLAADDSALTLAVLLTRRRDGVESFWRGERVTVARGQVAWLGTRSLARGRSALLAGAVVAGAALAAGTLSGGLGGGPPVGGGGGGPR